MNESNYDKKFHNGPYKGLCPICKKKAFWLHIPHLKGINFKNCKKFNSNYPLRACWDCFNKIPKGSD